MANRSKLEEMEKVGREELEERLENGGLLCRIICEILGGPKEHVEETIKVLVEKARQKDKRICLSGKIFDTVKQEEFFSAFAEMEILFFSKQALIDFCFNFMPSSVELMSPAHIEMSAQEFSNWINEIQGRVHEIDKIGKEGNAIKRLMNKRIAAIIRYNMLSHLKKENLEKEALRQLVGIDEISFDRYFETLRQRGEIVEKNGRCTLGSVVKFNAAEE